MSEKRKEKLKKNLVKTGLMAQEDTLLEYLQANYVERLVGRMGQWKQGWVYFTQERFICPTGILDEDIVIPYKDIIRIDKCSQGIFPIGITITYKNPDTGELMSDSFSMMKREKWIRFLAEKAGISVQDSENWFSK